MEQQIVVVEETGPFGQRMRTSLSALATKLNISEVDATKIISGLMVAYQNSEMREKFDACTTQSIFNAIHTAHSLRLPIDGRKLVHPIPYEIREFKNGKKVGTGRYEMQLQFGRGAYVNIMRREYPGAFITTGIIYKEDTFIRSKENGNDNYKHDVANATRSDYGAMIGTYAYIKYFSNGEWFSRLEVASRADIDKARAMGADGSKAWNNWMGEQAQKLPLKRLGKLTMEGLEAWEAMEAADNEMYDLDTDLKDVTGSQSSQAAQVEEYLRQANQGAIENKPEATIDVVVDVSDKMQFVGVDLGKGQDETVVSIMVDGEIVARTIEASALPPISDIVQGKGEQQEERVYPVVDDGMRADDPIVQDAVIMADNEAAPDAPSDEEELEEVTLADTGSWDGRTVLVGGFPNTRDFPNASAAGLFLLNEMKAIKSIVDRRSVYQENPALVKALATPDGLPLIEQMTRLITTKGKKS